MTLSGEKTVCRAKGKARLKSCSGTMPPDARGERHSIGRTRVASVNETLTNATVENSSRFPAIFSREGVQAALAASLRQPHSGRAQSQGAAGLRAGRR